MKRIVIVAYLLALCLLDSLFSVHFRSAEAAQPVPVIVQQVEVGSITDRVEALGTLRAREAVDITATVTDTITEIRFGDGQRVQKGDVLVEMTSMEEHALLEEELSKLAEARKLYERLLPLVKKGAASEALLDQQLRELDTAQARLQGVRSRLQDRLILAPFSGVVGLRNISVGTLIEPGDMITTLDDDSIMKLDFTVPAVHLPVLQRGLTIEATSAAYGNRIFKGTIASVDSRIDPVTRAILVRAELANDSGLLKPGLLMNVTLLNNPRDGLLIPEEALIPSGRGNHVLVVEPETSPVVVERREVQIGLRLPGEVEIVAGLTSGEYVVIHGVQRARPGQPVVVQAVAAGGETLAELLSGGQEDDDR